MMQVIQVLKISGQIPSGKNSVIVTRSGLRFPSKRFVAWRKHALEEINKTKAKCEPIINFPVSVVVQYIAADKRRRDMPGMIDALWHVLEKAEIVADDTFLGGYNQYVDWSHHGINKEEAGVIIKIGKRLL